MVRFRRCIVAVTRWPRIVLRKWPQRYTIIRCHLVDNININFEFNHYFSENLILCLFAMENSHSFGEKFSKSQWFKEVNGQREILNLYGGVRLDDVRGMRAPFLQIGGNRMFEMLYDANFTYDSSMPIFENSPPLWPYTLDYQLTHECMITPCPTKSFPGVWEVGK